MYGRGQKEPSFSSRPALTLNTAISQRCSEPVEMTWLQPFCLVVGWRETRRKIDCIVFGEYRDIDCQSEMSLSISPHLHIPARVDIFREAGAFLFFCSFLALARCFTSADRCFYLAGRAQCTSNIINYLLAG